MLEARLAGKAKHAEMGVTRHFAISRRTIMNNAGKPDLKKVRDTSGPLNFDSSLLHEVISLIHFLSLADAGETLDDRHGFAATMCGLANDVHPPSVLPWK